MTETDVQREMERVCQLACEIYEILDRVNTHINITHAEPDGYRESWIISDVCSAYRFLRGIQTSCSRVHAITCDLEDFIKTKREGENNGQEDA